MHTLDLLDQAIGVANALGYRIRRDWLDGQGGGRCEIGGEKWIFIDTAQSPLEQLESVLEALAGDASLASTPLPPGLETLLRRNRAA